MILELICHTFRFVTNNCGVGFAVCIVTYHVTFSKEFLSQKRTYLCLLISKYEGIRGNHHTKVTFYSCYTFYAKKWSDPLQTSLMLAISSLTEHGKLQAFLLELCVCVCSAIVKGLWPLFVNIVMHQRTLSKASCVASVARRQLPNLIRSKTKETVRRAHPV